MIENRELAVGTRLVARYKKQDYFAEVVLAEGAEEGRPIAGRTVLRFRLEDGREFQSPSAAGSAVMGGQACNGWRFWSPAGEGAGAQEAEVKSKAQSKRKARANGKQLLRRMEAQEGVPEGQVKWFCTACQAAFLVEGEAEPEACPQGHRQEDLTAVETAPAVES